MTFGIVKLFKLKGTQLGSSNHGERRFDHFHGLGIPVVVDTVHPNLANPESRAGDKGCVHTVLGSMILGSGKQRTKGEPVWVLARWPCPWFWVCTLVGAKGSAW